jgi:putative transposase
MKQTSFFKSNWRHQLCHGGTLRQTRKGRNSRPLSTREPLHCVFKINSNQFKLRGLRHFQSFRLIHEIVDQYAKHFRVGVEQISIQQDHLHLLIRTRRRSQFHHFFRVVAGQIAQRFEKKFWIVTDTPKDPQKGTKRQTSKGLKRKSTGLWKFRPYSRVVRGFKAYKTVRDYIQLNEQEALRKIPYRKERLRGLSMRDWEILWA